MNLRSDHSVQSVVRSVAPSPLSWIERFVNRPENVFLCAVDETFIRDRFNLIGLNEVVPDYEQAVCTVLDDSGGRPGMDVASNRSRRTAELFYGLTHARFVLTPRGSGKMLEKYQTACFGHCPRVNCNRMPVLPIGLYSEPGRDTVKLYCPGCVDTYVPVSGTKGAATDGAYFGTDFPHMAFMNHPEFQPQRPGGRHVAKIYGFRLHKSAEELQRRVTAAMHPPTNP